MTARAPRRTASHCSYHAVHVFKKNVAVRFSSSYMNGVTAYMTPFISDNYIRLMTLIRLCLRDLFCTNTAIDW